MVSVAFADRRSKTADVLTSPQWYQLRLPDRSCTTVVRAVSAGFEAERDVGPRAVIKVSVDGRRCTVDGRVHLASTAFHRLRWRDLR